MTSLPIAVISVDISGGEGASCVASHAIGVRSPLGGPLPVAGNQPLKMVDPCHLWEIASPRLILYIIVLLLLLL